MADSCMETCCVACVQGICIACCVTTFELCRDIFCRPACNFCCNGLFNCCASCQREPKTLEPSSEPTAPATDASPASSLDYKAYDGGGGALQVEPPSTQEMKRAAV